LKASQNQDLFSLFQGNIVCGDEVEHGKPAPDLFLEGAKKLGIEGNCLVFEDAASGVLAGLAANFDVIWVPDINSDPCKNLQERCKQVLYSMEDFIAEDYGF
jgi:beta-phosphoglucomutase-like phosphatase (HAD superfamily)